MLSFAGISPPPGQSICTSRSPFFFPDPSTGSFHRQFSATNRQGIRLRDKGTHLMERRALAHPLSTLAFSGTCVSTVSKGWRLNLAFFLLCGTEAIHAQQFVDECSVVSPPTGDSSAISASNLPSWKLHRDGTRIAVSRWTPSGLRTK